MQPLILVLGYNFHKQNKKIKWDPLLVSIVQITIFYFRKLPSFLTSVDNMMAEVIIDTMRDKEEAGQEDF